MGNYYRRELASLARLGPDGKLDPVYWAAGVVYLLLAFGILFFVVPEKGDEMNFVWVAMRGFAFGAVVYGVYEFTNFATLRNWSVSLVVVDTLWGGILCSLTSMVIVFIQERLS